MSNQPTRRDRDAAVKARAFRREAERKRGRDAMRAKSARKTAPKGRPTITVPAAFYDRLLAVQAAWLKAGGVGEGPIQQYHRTVGRLTRDMDSPIRVGNIQTRA